MTTPTHIPPAMFMCDGCDCGRLVDELHRFAGICLCRRCYEKAVAMESAATPTEITAARDGGRGDGKEQ